MKRDKNEIAINKKTDQNLVCVDSLNVTITMAAENVVIPIIHISELYPFSFIIPLSIE